MSSWDIASHTDLKKIPLLDSPEITDHEQKMAHRVAALRRRGLVKGNELTTKGQEFVAHCMQHYTKFGHRLSLCHATQPDSYPEFEEGVRSGNNSQWYWDALSEANDLLRSCVFEGGVYLLEEAPAVVRQAADFDLVFGRAVPQRPNSAHKPLYKWSPNWDSYGGNCAGADDQHLVAENYDHDHFSQAIGGWEDFDYLSPADALAGVYYELWAFYLFSVHYTQVTDSKALTSLWRYNLASTLSERFEQAVDALHLCAMATACPPGSHLGFLTSPAEFAEQSDENLLLLRPYLAALEKMVDVIHEEVAHNMRQAGYIVVKSNGQHQCVLDNGARMSSHPFQDVVREMLVTGKCVTVTISAQALALHCRMSTVFDGPPSEAPIKLIKPFLKLPDAKG